MLVALIVDLTSTTTWIPIGKRGKPGHTKSLPQTNIRLQRKKLTMKTNSLLSYYKSKSQLLLNTMEVASNQIVMVCSVSLEELVEQVSEHTESIQMTGLPYLVLLFLMISARIGLLLVHIQVQLSQNQMHQLL